MKWNIHVFYGLLLDPHAKGNLGECTLLHMYPYDFLIVTITCAWLLLRLLTVYGFRLSTQVQMYSLLVQGGTLKTTSEALLQMVRWSVHWGPHSGIFVPFAFLLLFPLLLHFCILSFRLPTNKAQLTEIYKTSVLTKNTGMPLHSFKGDLSGIGDSTETSLMSHWIISDTF